MEAIPDLFEAIQSFVKGGLGKAFFTFMMPSKPHAVRQDAAKQLVYP
jgi:hypothetical protein